MNKQELIEKLQDIEWEDFEVKEAKHEIPKNVFETVSAFANTAGGWIIFGIKQNKDYFEIQGVSNPEKIEQDFTTALRTDKFNRKIIPISKKYNIDNKIILAFYISLSERKPVYFNNPKNTFIRTGLGDQRATQEEIDSFFRDSAYGTKDKEVTNYILNDLDKETLERFHNQVLNLESSSPYKDFNKEDLFEKLRVTINGKVTIAGLLMFGNEDLISSILPDFMIDYMEIRGNSYSDALERYSYRMPLQKNLYNYFFSIFEKLVTKIDVPFKTKGIFRYEDQPHVLALREALVNLLAHSDYFSPMKPRIRVFYNRIEFLNPGSLPASVETLRKQELTLPRNPILIKLFRVLKLAENAGYGFDKMFQGWKSYYPTYPVTRSEISYYKIDFYVNAGANAGANAGVKLTKLQIKIIHEIKEKNNITSKEIAILFRKDVRTIERNLSKLQLNKFIKRIGSDKAGHWQVL
jgi:ATP-dependent DNA helicase RecG